MAQEEQQIQRPRVVRAVYHVPYATTCLPDHEWQRAKLEQMRVKWSPDYKHMTHTLAHLRMFAKKYLPWLYVGMALRGFW